MNFLNNLKMKFLFCRQSNYPFIFFGLSVGIALGLILTPIFDNDCTNPSQDVHLSGVRTLHSDLGHKEADGDDFEPVLRLTPKFKKRTPETKTPVRSRYYSTELQIKEKLFVGVISDGSTIGTLGVAINKTLAHHVSKLVLFTDVASPDKVPKSLASSVVSFVDEQPLLKPFHVLHYIAEHFLKDYDFFLIVRDTTYIRGKKLREMVNQLSVAQNVYMGGSLGSNNDLSQFCDLDGGIVVSNSVVRAMVEQLNWCIRNAVSEDGSDNVGRCILHSCNQSCRQHVQGQNFTIFKMGENFDMDAILTHGSQHQDFNTSMSAYPVHDAETIYKLHLHFSLVDLDETRAAIYKVQCNIVSTNEYLPEDMRCLSWPIGTPASTKPHDRFDNVRWHYLTETHIYLDSDLSNLRPLTMLEKSDIADVINSSARHLEEKYHSQIVFKRFEHGYRKFDPNRGMDYIVSLKFLEAATGSHISKRVKALRPLGKVELIPVPYVTESTRVVIFLPVMRNEHENVVTFLKDFAKVCLEKQDSTMLVLVLLYNSQSVGEGSDTEEKFTSLKNLIYSYNNKYEVDGAKLSWTAIKMPGTAISDLAIVDLVAKKFSQDTLILMARPGMEIRMDYLNRVKMNTISGWQVFFPIPFTEYNPEIVYQDKARPTILGLNKNYGHFDEHSTSHFSFYNSDYQMARKLIEAEVPLVKTEWDMKRDSGKTESHSVLSVFLNAEHLHVLRGVEPALRLRFRETKCSANMTNPESYQQCLLHTAEGIASRSQLATFILKNHNGKQMLTDLYQEQNRQDLEIER